MIKLSVLDQSPIRSGSDAGSALQETIDLARHCEKLGYYRYWLAEHHASDALAGCSPEVLLGRLGAETQSIRIGSGGVMLPHYSPYKVAENFKLLETLYPGRVDLGVGRAPGTDPFTAAALRYGASRRTEYFPTMVADLQALLYDQPLATPGITEARAFPITQSPPQLWMLGSSDDSIGFAADAGLPYSFAYFINPQIDSNIFKRYKEQFKPGPGLKEPYCSLSVFVICAETDEQAELLSHSRDLWFLRLLQGAPGPVPRVEEALEYEYSKYELQAIHANRESRAVGDPQTVKAKLVKLAQQFDVDELVILTITHDLEARRRSYELLADAWIIH